MPSHFCPHYQRLLFESTYTPNDGIERSTAFNKQFVLNTFFGKECRLGAAKQNALTFDTKVTTSGGAPYSPIDVDVTRATGGRVEVITDEQAFSER